MAAEDLDLKLPRPHLQHVRQYKAFPWGYKSSGPIHLAVNSTCSYKAGHLVAR